MSWYDKGEAVRLTATFRDIAGVLYDPASVVCKVETPAGARTTYTPAHDSTGVYHKDVTTTESGEWSYRFEGTAGAVAEAKFNVRLSAF